MRKFIVRYADWTFDFIECAEEDFPALQAAIVGASKTSVVEMPSDSNYPWNESYLKQPWKGK